MKWSPRLKRLVLGIIACALVAARAEAAIEIVGAVAGYALETNAAGNVRAVLGLQTGGAVEIAPFAHDLVRVRFHWGGLWNKEDVGVAKAWDAWSAADAVWTDLGDVLRLETESLRVDVVKGPQFAVHFYDREGRALLEDDRIEFDTGYSALNDATYRDIRTNAKLPVGFAVKSVKKMPAREAYFGFGEYAGPLNRRGRDIQGWNSDVYAWGEFRNPMYMTLPFFYGVRAPEPGRPASAYGLFFNNPARPVFKMGTQWADKYSFEAGDGQLDYFFFGGGYGHTMGAVFDRYTELTGRPCLLPKWGYGYHQSRYSYDNQGWVRWLASEFRNRDIPLDALYLDIDYMDANADGSYKQLSMDANFSDTPGMLAHCESKGVKVVPLVEPWLRTGDAKWGAANAAGHLVKFNNGQTYASDNWFGWGSWIDFSSTPARDWWKGQVLGFLDQYAFAGIWNDLNEPASNGENDKLPLNALYWDDGRYGTGNADSRRWELNEHNVFAVRECSSTFDTLMSRYPGKRPFVLSRAGWPGIQRYALNWSGDNTASWDHNRHNIGLGVSVMISGQPNFGHDLGGFIGSTTPELLTRWTEWGALTPFCRNHSTKGTVEREPWRFGEPYTTYLRDSIKLRYKLMPYLYALAWGASAGGEPMNTPTVFHFPDDTNTWSRNDNDFMVGPSLLAAPVVTQGATTRWVYLPAGADWYGWYDNRKFAGGQWVQAAAPLGSLPLFVRAGAILPMGPALKHANEYAPNWMDIHVWPQGTNTFALFEDDGETTNYLAGANALTDFDSESDAEGWTFAISARAGTYNPGPRAFYIYASEPKLLQDLTLDGVSLPLAGSLGAVTSGWTLTSAGRLAIKVPDTGAGGVLRATWGPADYAMMAVAGTFNGWNTWGNMVPVGSNTWRADLALTNASGVRFKFVGNRSWNQTWGETAQSQFGAPVLATAEPNGGDIRMDGTLNGLYRFEFNDRTLEYSMTRLGGAVSWVGDVYHWPPNGSITSNNSVWVNLESWPKSNAVSAAIVYSTDGTNWLGRAMTKAGEQGNNDWWNVNLGKFPGGARLRYAVNVKDGFGKTIWNSAGGTNYLAVVNP